MFLLSKLLFLSGYMWRLQVVHPAAVFNAFPNVHTVHHLLALLNLTLSSGFAQL